MYAGTSYDYGPQLGQTCLGCLTPSLHRKLRSAKFGEVVIGFETHLGRALGWESVQQQTMDWGIKQSCGRPLRVYMDVENVLLKIASSRHPYLLADSTYAILHALLLTGSKSVFFQLCVMRVSTFCPVDAFASFTARMRTWKLLLMRIVQTLYGYPVS